MVTCLQVFFKGGMMLFAMALIGFIEYMYYDGLIRTMFSGGMQATAYTNIFFNGSIVVMITWSMLATYFTNPGYVDSYMRSELLSGDTHHIFLKGCTEPLMTVTT